MKQSYFKIYSWMVDDLELYGNDLIAFALIYSFNENNLPFNGSLSYLQKRLGISRNTTLRSLKYLCEKSFLLKETSGINGNKTVNYIINISHEKINPSNNNPTNRPVQNMTPTGSKMKPDRFKISIVPVQNMTPTGSILAPNNKDKEKDNKITTTTKENEFVAVDFFDFSQWKNWKAIRGLITEIHGEKRDLNALQNLHEELLEKGTILNDPKAFWKSKILKGAFRI